MASGVCFYCGNPINPNGPHVFALIEHRYADGKTKQTDRNFHGPCFDKFEQHGRPRNPGTEYEVLSFERV